MTFDNNPPEGEFAPATPLYDATAAPLTDSDAFGGTPPAPSASPSVTDEAAGVANDAKTAATDVAGTVKDQAADVAHEAKGQAKDLYRQTVQELREQTGTQQKRVAEGLRTVGDQLGSMADGADQGVASDLVRQVSDRTASAARWLDDRDPGSLLDEVRSFAARKPGVFIAVAALGGIVAGRLTTSLIAGAKADAAESDER
jgi:hypothetical protein